MPAKKLTSHSQLPLHEKEWIETDPETGGEISVKQSRRGVLATESRTYDPVTFFSILKRPRPSAREALEGFCNMLRDNLEKRGLLSDRTPHWCKVGDADWEPFNAQERPTGHTVAYAHWTSRLKKLAEPLSRELAAGELLSGLIDLLEDKDFTDKHLRKIQRLLNLFGDYRVSGNFNVLAHQALIAREARAKGPAARRSRADDVRRLIMAYAESHWSAHPLRRGDASNTAASIVDAVNTELQSSGLLPSHKKGLSVKTLSDHIRAGIRGKNCGTGQSGDGIG